MKALFTLKSAINQSSLTSLVAMLVLAPAIYPAPLAFASQASKAKNAIVFKIQDPSVLLANSNSSDENQNSPAFSEAAGNDPLTTRLQTYLKDHNSPLAPYAGEMVQLPQWQRALAISWVESNFGRFCSGNNCSGIGGAPGQASWRTYDNKLEWFKDMAALMETPRYKEKYTTFEKMRGVYVQPGTASWVYGAKTKYAELMSLTTQAEEEKTALANQAVETANLQTFPQLAFAQ